MAWAVVIAVVAAANYAAELRGAPASPPDLLFRWSTSIATIVLDLVLLVFVMLIARGLPVHEAFALRAPRSWREALRIAGVALALVYATSFVIELTLGHAGREQSVPQFWDAARLPAFLASAFAIAIVVPVTEELLCRGVGFALLERWGDTVAIAGTALAFALAHGAVHDLPWVLVTGLGLGYLRARTGSVLPCVVLHMTINGVAVVVAVLAAPM